MNEVKVNGEDLVFGLDIGTRSVVGTVGYRQGDRFVVTAQEIRQHQTRAMLDGQIHDINRVAATIADIRQSLQEKIGVKLDEVCIAAAGRVLKTVNVHVDMDLDRERNITKDDMNSLISFGIEQAFSDFQEKNDMDMHFYCVGYSVVRYFLNGLWMGQPEHHKARTIGADMIATFLPDDVVDGLYSAVELAGLKVANLTLEPIAAIRVAIPEKFRLLNIAMVDIGAGTSDISITADGNIIAFGMIPHAGDSLTEILAKTCLIDFGTAEMIKTAATQQEEIVYEDIMGMEQTITAKEVIDICQPEIEKMAKLAADTVRELNGGTPPSAVFIVGGGGKIKGFDDLIAAELGLDPKRAALRGEEIMRDIDFPEGALRDSTIITPIGICLTYYDQYNNFIYITFNGNKVKLYDNNKLTVTDAAIQADFTREGLFPRRGEELRYSVNGQPHITKGEYGESAHVYVNGEEVNLSHNIRANDIIVLEEATLGASAHDKIADVAEFSGRIPVRINGDEMQLPKPVKVNGVPVTEEYEIQNGDEIEISTSYTYEELFAFMDISPEDMVLIVNGEKVDDTIEIVASDQLEIRNRKEYELKEIYKESQREAFKESVKEQVAKAEKMREQAAAKAHEAKNQAAKKEAAEPAQAEQPTEAADQTSAEPETSANSQTAAHPSEPSTEKAAEPTPAETAAVEPAQTAEASAADQVSEPEAAPTPEQETAPSSQSAGREPSAETVESTSAEPAPSAASTIPETASANASTQSGQQAEPVKDANAASSTMGHGTSAPEARKPNIPKTEPETGKKIIVIVNQKPIVMRGKQSYMFVDIFDYIDFDTSRMRGSGIATLVNGRDAQYTQELYNGDKIEVYWK